MRILWIFYVLLLSSVLHAAGKPDLIGQASTTSGAEIEGLLFNPEIRVLKLESELPVTAATANDEEGDEDADEEAVEDEAPPPQIFAVLLYGSYNRKGWTLYYKGEKVKIFKNGAFSLGVGITAVNNKVALKAVGPNGEVDRQTINIKIDGWIDPNAYKPFSALSTGLSLTQIAFSQSDKEDISGSVLTLKASYRYSFSKLWDVGVSGYLTLLPLRLSPAGSSIGFLGINLRVGYVLPNIQAPWRLAIYTGPYYAKTLSGSHASNSTLIGFQIPGFQLTPVLTRSFNSGQSLGVYFKVAPVSSDFKISFSNRELALGSSFKFKPDKSGSMYSLQADFATLAMTIGNVELSSRSASLGVNYLW